MTDLNNWEQQPGGLYLAVQPFDKNNAEHRDAADSIMRRTIQTVAQAHGAAFSKKDFSNNMRAVYSGDIRLDLFLAKWEICTPHPIYLGAALNWNTVGIDPYGKLTRAVYTEDVCLLTDKLRQLISEKPNGKTFPEESLAECFERINLQNMLSKEGAWYRFGEVNRDNTRMMRQLNGNGAIIGGSDSAVLEFKRLPNNLLDKWPVDVKVISLKKDGRLDENNFIVRWHDGSHDIRFIATKGRATALGQPRADIRPWHNGNLPEQDILECVIASSLLAMKQEAENRKWGDQPRPSIPSPIIPLLAPKSEIHAALYGACGNALMANAADQPPTFDKPMSDAHVHVINEQQMLDAFIAVGAKPRLFGGKAMMPGVNVLKHGGGLAL